MPVCNHCKRDLGGKSSDTCPVCAYTCCATSGSAYSDCTRSSGECPAIGRVSNEPCPKCGDLLIWKQGKYSFFRACPTYPHCDGKIASPRGRHKKASTTFSGKTEPAPMPQPTPAPSQLASQIWEEIKPVAKRDVETWTVKAEPITIESVKAIVDEAVAKIPARTLGITSGSRPVAKLEGLRHKAVDQVLEAIAAGFENIMLVGPAGSGKTTIAKDVARALDRMHAVLSLSGGVTESRIVGRGVPILSGPDAGESRYESTQSVEAYVSGGVILWDEIDGADPNVLLCTQAATSNGHLPIPSQQWPVCERHPDTVIMIAANTFGLGADRMYVGRNQLDAAFLDRFVGATIEVDYDRDLERGLGIPDKVLDQVWEIREKVMAAKLRRIVGTRFAIAAGKWFAKSEKLEASVRLCMTGWTTDELRTAGVSP